MLKSLSFPVPFIRGGRLHVGFERLGAEHPRGLFMGSKLQAELFHRGRSQGRADLGSGLVTNVGTLAIANCFGWANPSGVANDMIALSNYHATGTGTTAAAATDYKLQTVSTQGGQTPVAGTQSLVQPAALGTNSQQYQTVATISYTGAEAVTEWGLFNAGALSASTGSPFTATSATGGTCTGTALTASSTTVRGEQLYVLEAQTTASFGLILSNTTSVFNIGKWYAQSTNAAGTTPGATEAYLIRPGMLDHKVFSAINVASGDSIQFTYTLTIQSGG